MLKFTPNLELLKVFELVNFAKGVENKFGKSHDNHNLIHLIKNGGACEDGYLVDVEPFIEQLTLDLAKQLVFKETKLELVGSHKDSRLWFRLR